MEAVAVGIEWMEQVESDQLSAAADAFRSNAEAFKFLSTEKRLPAFQLRIENDVASLDPPGQAFVLDFVRVGQGEKIEWALSLRPDLLSFTCSSYERWAQFKPLAIQILSACAPSILKSNSIKAIGLQYSDAFKWTSQEYSVFSEVLRADSNLLPASVHSRKSLWHSHNGWFSEGSKNRRLLNLVNVDTGKEDASLFLRIHGQHRLLPARFEDAGPTSIGLDELPAILDELHRFNKLALQAVLNDAALNLIHMEKVE